MLKKASLILIVLFSVMVLPASSAHASWFIYHKPAFKGKVIDAETKEPIEGAVVVAVYNKKSIGIAESYSVEIKVKEALTDKNGVFYISSYTTVIQPLSWEYTVDFIIYKPGYGNFPDGRVYPTKGLQVTFEEFFSDEIGTVKEVTFIEPWKLDAMPESRKIMSGIVELPKLNTKEERIRAIPGRSPEVREKAIELNKLISGEDKYLGLK